MESWENGCSRIFCQGPRWYGAPDKIWFIIIITLGFFIFLFAPPGWALGYPLTVVECARARYSLSGGFFGGGFARTLRED